MADQHIEENNFSSPYEDFWHHLPCEVKKAINLAKDKLDRGEGLPHDDVMFEIKSRFQSK